MNKIIVVSWLLLSSIVLLGIAYFSKDSGVYLVSIYGFATAAYIYKNCHEK